ncbi:hypothetical protein [Methyloglobulus sp.]|uniref:hypothetical protein n=1 Tax=Methyloglobulus sp. TaxID=2518622 RepID=UPI003989173C
MSNEENVKKSVESAKTIVSNQVAAFMGLKEKNPKAFYGILVALILPILILMMSGGESNSVSGPSIKELAVGQKYVLKSPNTVDPSGTVRLVPVPGTLAAYDDSEEADRNAPCQHMTQGTPVEVMEFSDFSGKRKMFVKVKVVDGECKDKDGWVLAIDVQ